MVAEIGPMVENWEKEPREGAKGKNGRIVILVLVLAAIPKITTFNVSRWYAKLCEDSKMHRFRK